MVYYQQKIFRQIGVFDTWVWNANYAHCCPSIIQQLKGKECILSVDAQGCYEIKHEIWVTEGKTEMATYDLMFYMKFITGSQVSKSIGWFTQIIKLYRMTSHRCNCCSLYEIYNKYGIQLRNTRARCLLGWNWNKPW